MTLAALLLLAVPQDAGTLMRNAGAKLNAPCVTDCGPPPPDRRYRVDREADLGDRKAGAVNETGRRCAIDGPTLCTRPPKKLLSAPLSPR